MNASPVIITATIRAKPGQEQALAQALRDLVRFTRDEPGCLQFDIHQDRQDPSVFILWEHFVDQAAFDAHLQMSYTRAYFDKGSADSTSAVNMHRL